MQPGALPGQGSGVIGEGAFAGAEPRSMAAAALGAALRVVDQLVEADVLDEGQRHPGAQQARVQRDARRRQRAFCARCRSGRP